MPLYGYVRSAERTPQPFSPCFGCRYYDKSAGVYGVCVIGGTEKDCAENRRKKHETCV